MSNETTGHQHASDQTKLEQTMPPGTDEATSRQGAVGRAKARRSVAGQLALGAVIVVALAVLLPGLPHWLPPADQVRPMASGTAAAADITLIADIQLYTPAMSSAQGITITARDPVGNLIKGSWEATWGMFPLIDGQGRALTSFAYTAGNTKDTALVLWRFPPEFRVSDNIPQGITIAFTTSDGRKATMALKRDQERQGFVHVVQPLGELNLRVNTDGYAYSATRNLDIPLRIEAVDAVGNPITGDWEADYGVFNGDFTSTGKGSHMNAQSTAGWWFVAEAEADVPDTTEITFTAPDGRTKTLHLIKDPDDPWALRITPAEILFIPWEPSITRMVSVDPTPIPAADPGGPTPIELALALPEWVHGVDFDPKNLPLAEDAQPEKYRKYAGGFPRHPTQDAGSVGLPEGWDLRVERKGNMTVLDETGRAIGSLVCCWLDTDWASDPAVFYGPLLGNHTGVMSFQKLDGYPCAAYRLLLEKDNGTAASGIPGVTIQSRTVFLPGLAVQNDGKTYALAYMLTLNKAVTGNGPIEYLLSNETIDFIAAGWEAPEPVTAGRLAARQTVEDYFQAWRNKDEAIINDHVTERMKGFHQEFDAIDDIALLDCTDITKQARGRYSYDWYANPADVAVFAVRFRLQYAPGADGPFASGDNEADCFLVKERPDGPWILAMLVQR